MSRSSNAETFISSDELAHYAAALLKRIREHSSDDIDEFKIAEKFFTEYIKDTECLKAFAAKNNYKIVISKAH